MSKKQFWILLSFNISYENGMHVLPRQIFVKLQVKLTFSSQIYFNKIKIKIINRTYSMN